MAAIPNIKPQEADESTTLALANVGELAVGVFRSLSGTSLSNMVNDSELTKEAIANLVIGRVTKNLTKRAMSARQSGQYGQ